MTEKGHVCDNRGNAQEMPYRVQCGCNKLATYDWLKDIPTDHQYDEIIFQQVFTCNCIIFGVAKMTISSIDNQIVLLRTINKLPKRVG